MRLENAYTPVIISMPASCMVVHAMFPLPSVGVENLPGICLAVKGAKLLGRGVFLSMVEDSSFYVF